MMGRLKDDQGQLFYEFHLSDAVPEDHLVRKIDTALGLSWLRSELAPHYSSMGRPSIDPELMIRMLVVGYVFALRSEYSTSCEHDARPIAIATRTLTLRNCMAGSPVADHWARAVSPTSIFSV